MTTWVPGLVVLAFGIGAGLLMARRFQGARATDGSDVQLRVEDLRARRDDLYRRLKEMDQGVIPDTDRESLEHAAARTLRELESVEADFKRKHPKLARQNREEAAPSSTEDARPAPSSARVFVTGFAYGAGLLLLIGGLIYWAVRDAKPREDSNGPMAAAPAPQEAHPETGALPPQVAQRIEALGAQLAQNPDDLEVRKQLGYIYLGTSRFIEAFEQAGAILERQPDDPDGLYLQGIVRLTMGQWQIAEGLLQRALTVDPTHVDALTAAGVIRLRLNDYEQAIEFWERGRMAFGGSHPMLDRMVALAQEGRSPEEILGMPAVDPSSAPAPPAQPATPAADVYTLTLDIAAGKQVPPGSTLFVSLRGGPTGPPTAVKRINRPIFPMTITLGQADSMMGALLPESGTVSARLDADGSASTRDASDLAASAEVSVGDAISLTLDAG